MNTQLDVDEATQTLFVSTGRLPPVERVRTLVAEAHERYKSTAEGKNSEVYPALAEVPSDLFGVCVVGTLPIRFLPTPPTCRVPPGS
jgi:glutaminase